LVQQVSQKRFKNYFHANDRGKLIEEIVKPNIAGISMKEKQMIGEVSINMMALKEIDTAGMLTFTRLFLAKVDLEKHTYFIKKAIAGLITVFWSKII
jgi:hypothetical protein